MSRDISAIGFSCWHPITEKSAHSNVSCFISSPLQTCRKSSQPYQLSLRVSLKGDLRQLLQTCWLCRCNRWPHP